MIIIENGYCDNCSTNNVRLIEVGEDEFGNYIYECDNCGCLVYEDGSIYNEE